MAKPEDDKEIYGAPLDLPKSSPRHSLPKHKKKWIKTIIKLLVFLIVIGAIGYAIYYLKYLPNPPKKESSDTPIQSQAVTSSKNNDEVIPATDFKKHVGDFPRIELTYPSNWTLTEKDNGVQIVSPDFSYETSDKGTVKGNFSVYLRQGARASEGKYIGRGLAVRPTEKLVYKAPSSTQRKDTNLTLFGLDKSTHFSYFMISGDYVLAKEETLGPSYGKEAETYIIVGGFGSTKQIEPMDYANLPLDKATNLAVYKQGIEIVKSLKVF